MFLIWELSWGLFSARWIAERQSRNQRQNPSTQRKGVSRGKMRKVKKLTTEARRHGEKSCLIYKLQKIAASGVRNSADCAAHQLLQRQKLHSSRGYSGSSVGAVRKPKSVSRARARLRDVACYVSTHWFMPLGIHLSRNCCKALMLFCHLNAAREVVSGNGLARGDGLW